MVHNMGCGVFSLLLVLAGMLLLVYPLTQWRGAAGLLYLCPRFFQSLFWCMGVACGVQRTGFFGTRALLGSTVDTCYSGGFRRIFHIFHVAVHSNPEASGLRSRRMEKRAQSMLLVVVALSAVRTLTLDIISRAPQLAFYHNFRCVVQHFSGSSMMKKSSSSRAHAN